MTSSVTLISVNMSFMRYLSILTIPECILLHSSGQTFGNTDRSISISQKPVTPTSGDMPTQFHNDSH